VLEIGKALSFFLSILSLYPIVGSAFFVPGARWQERLSMSLLKIAMAGCICLGSGLFFCRPSPAGRIPGVKDPDEERPLSDRLFQTLPVRMFLWTLVGVAALFLVSWYIEEYFVPLMWRNQPYEIGLALNFLPK
jgi:hypothetical protein